MNKCSAYESRQKIINVAEKIFSRYGYNGATMRMIAKEANISIGGLYLHFKNKEELSLFLLKKRIEEFFEKILKPVESIESPAEALKALIKNIAEYAKENREFIIMHTKEHGFTFGLNIKKEFFKKERGIIKNIIQKGIASGEFSNSYDSEEVAKVILNITRGFVMSVVVDSENLFNPEECLDILLYGLLNKNRS